MSPSRPVPEGTCRGRAEPRAKQHRVTFALVAIGTAESRRRGQDERADYRCRIEAWLTGTRANRPPARHSPVRLPSPALSAEQRRWGDGGIVISAGGR